MSSNKHIYTNTTPENLIGNNSHQDFLKLQAAYGIAQRGGVRFPTAGHEHDKRLVSDINILTSGENKRLVFSELVAGN